MAKKRYRAVFLFFGALVLGILAVSAAARADAGVPFSASNGTVTAVDAAARTTTVSYMMQPMMGRPCIPAIPSSCEPRTNNSPSDVLHQDQVLVTDAGDEVMTVMMSVGDSVRVYFKTEGGTTTPYAVKDMAVPSPFPIKPCDTRIMTPGAGINASGTVHMLQSPGTDLNREFNGIPPLGTITPPGEMVGRPVPPWTGRPCPPGNPHIVITIDVGFGDQGDQVLVLQQKLQALGYFPNTITPTGYFGQATRKAVMDFQAAKGVRATGYVGPLTRNVLEK